MKIKPIKKIENNVCSIEIKVTSLGNNNLTEDEERELLANFPKKVVYKDLNFEKKVKVDGKNVVVDDVAGTDTITLSLVNKEFTLDENMNITYSVDASKISASEKTVNLTSIELVAMAKVVVFEAVIIEEIKRLLDEVRAISNDFETEEQEVMY